MYAPHLPVPDPIHSARPLLRKTIFYDVMTRKPCAPKLVNSLNKINPGNKDHPGEPGDTVTAVFFDRCSL